MLIEAAEVVKRRPPVFEKISISRVRTVNPLNQPPKTQRTFSIVIFMLLWYLVAYFLMVVVMNLVMFISSDFIDLTQGGYKCPHRFISLYIILDVVPAINFGIALWVFKYVTKNFSPRIDEYVFNKQQTKVKFVTFYSPNIKCAIVFIDILHIMISIVGTRFARQDPNGLQVC